jgi:hypothetical protein
VNQILILLLLLCLLVIFCLLGCWARRIGFDFELQLPGGELAQRGIGVVWIKAGRANDALALKAELAFWIFASWAA